MVGHFGRQPRPTEEFGVVAENRLPKCEQKLLVKLGRIVNQFTTEIKSIHMLDSVEKGGLLEQEGTYMANNLTTV